MPSSAKSLLRQPLALRTRRRKPTARTALPAAEPRRKRGAQPGNSNRLSHGRYTKAEAAHRRAIANLLRQSDNMIVWAGNITRARTALARKKASTTVSVHLPRVERFARKRERVGAGAQQRALKNQHASHHRGLTARLPSGPLPPAAELKNRGSP